MNPKHSWSVSLVAVSLLILLAAAVPAVSALTQPAGEAAVPSAVPVPGVASAPLRELALDRALSPPPAATPRLSETAVLQISPPSQAVKTGTTFAVTVEAADLSSPVSGFQFDLAFDPAIVRYVRLQPGSLLAKTGRSVVCAVPVQPAAGAVRVACASAGELPGPIGGGPLAVLTFVAQQPGLSPLLLSGLQLAGAGVPPVSIPAAGLDGEVRVVTHQVLLPLVLRGAAGMASRATEAGEPSRPAAVVPASAAIQTPCYTADLNCDHRVDQADLSLAAGGWNCSAGDPCYAAAFDLDKNAVVDSLDLAWVGNEYDVRPPAITIVAPPPEGVAGGSPLQVTAVLTDAHGVISATVNGVPAVVNGRLLTATLALSDGNQTLVALATDALGQQGAASRVVSVDGAGPQIQIRAPRNRQSIYSLNPVIAISTTDYYAGVDPASLSAVLLRSGAGPVTVTGDLTVSPAGAWGALAAPLAGDTVYTLAVSVADEYGNASEAHSAFYVPPDPGAIVPPAEPAGAGWVSGVVFDSATCNLHLTACAGLPGASVTLAITGGLPISGTIVTGPDGFFALPLSQTGSYWLRVAKPGYTYGQRAAEVVRQRSAATNEIYLTPLDPAVTLCDQSGCLHASSDNALQVEIPPGAIPPGEVVTTTATNFRQVEFLPSGELPPGTWETYAFNLGGDSEITFTHPITVRQLNSLGFDPGSQIPLGYWNSHTLQWEHAGFGVVDPSGQWVVMTVTHFSNFDPNYPISVSQATPTTTSQTEEDKPCGAKDTGGSRVYLKSGRLVQEYSLPPVNVLGADIAPTLLFDSDRASPSHAIDVELSVAVGPGAEMGKYVNYALYVQGIKTADYYISSTLDPGEIGRFRYLWDGRDAQGNPLPSGVYDYRVDLSLPYRAQYCGATRFGGQPDCVNRPTGRFVEAAQTATADGTVALDQGADSPFGAGWALNGLQRLTVDQAGRILITDGERSDEFYYYAWDLLNGGSPRMPQAQAAVLLEKVGGNLVDLAPAYPGEANRMFRSFDVHYQDGVFTLWLNSTAGNNSVRWYSRTERFESQDGLIWRNRTATNLVRDGFAFYFLGGPRQIIRTGDLYQGWEVYYPETSSGWGNAVRYVTSNDGLAWTVVNEPALIGTVWPSVVRIDDSYQLWGNPDGDGNYGGTRSLRHRTSASPGTGWENWQTGGQLVRADGAEVRYSNRVRRLAGGVYQLFYWTGDNELTLATGTDGTTFSGAQKILPPLAEILPGFYRLRDFGLLFAAGSDWFYFTYQDASGVAHAAVYRTRPVVASLTATDLSTLVYDEAGQTFIRTYPDGRQVYFDGQGRHHFTLEPTGRIISYTYSAENLLTTMEIILPGETAARWRWSLVYAAGRLSAITDPAGRTTRFTVDRHNHLVAVAGPDGAVRRYAYTQDHWMTHAVDENGAVTEYAYDAHGRLTGYAKPPRPVYDPATGQEQMVREVRTFTPSDSSYPVINQSPTGDPDHPAPPVPTSDQLVDSVSYGRGGLSGHTDLWGSWLDQTDGEGQVTTFQYDQANNLIRTDRPDGSCTLYTYDGKGNKLSERLLEAADCHARALSPAGDERAIQAGIGWSYTYEPRFNRVKTATDPLGQTTTYWYDYELGPGEAGNRIRIVYPPVPDPAGGLVTPTQTFGYGAWGQVITETDPLGAVTVYRYTQGTPDEAHGGANPLFAAGVTPVPGLLAEVIRDYGDASRLNAATWYRDLDGAGNPGTVVGPGCCGLGQQTRYIYDAWGRVLTQEDALGIVTRTERDGVGNPVRQIQDYTPDGVTGRNVATLQIYDAGGLLLTRSTAADGLLVQERYHYDLNRQLAAQEDSLGHTTRFLYDDADRLVGQIDPAGYVVSRTYAANGQLETLTGASGRVTRYGYDGYRRLVTETVDAGGLNLSTRYSFDPAGNLLSQTDPTGAVTRYQYDSGGRRAAEVQAVAGQPLTRTYAYDAAGRLTRETDWRGMQKEHRYDPLGREVQTVEDAGGLNLTTVYTYSLSGALLAKQDPRGAVTTYQVDALDRVTLEVADAGGLALETRYGYDRLGHQLTVTDPKGAVTRSETNAFGQLALRVADYGGLNAAATYAYDGNLNLLSITDANDNRTVYRYDVRGVPTGTLYADGASATAGLDGGGRLAWRLDPMGTRLDASYDSAGRLAGQSFPDGSLQTLAYDAAGRLVRADQTMGGHTTQALFGYDELGGLVSTTQTLDGLSWTTTYRYDYARGAITVSYPSGVQVGRQIDVRNRLGQVSLDGTPVAHYAYDDPGGAMTVTLGNGVAIVYQTDALGRITRASSAASDYRYGYDPAGNRTYRQQWHQAGHPADVYQYDTLDRLVGVWTGADSTEPDPAGYQRLDRYLMDPLGSRLLVQVGAVDHPYLPNDGTRLTDPMSRYRQVDLRLLVYDANGNLLSDGVNAYGYDALNRQVSMTGPGGAAEYVYDALGRRVAKVVDGQTTYFVYNGDSQIIEERDGADQWVARYVYGSELDEPLAMERGGQRFFYQRDALGSVTEVANQAGVLVERYSYDVYGHPIFWDGAGLPLPGSAIGNPYLFTGRYYDPESGNYDYRARFYHPGLGRFLQMDPAGYADGLNLYQYVGSNPTNRVDPTGLWWWYWHEVRPLTPEEQAKVKAMLCVLMSNMETLQTGLMLEKLFAAGHIKGGVPKGGAYGQWSGDDVIISTDELRLNPPGPLAFDTLAHEATHWYYAVPFEGLWEMTGVKKSAEAVGNRIGRIMEGLENKRIRIVCERCGEERTVDTDELNELYVKCGLKIPGRQCPEGFREVSRGPAD